MTLIALLMLGLSGSASVQADAPRAPVPPPAERASPVPAAPMSAGSVSVSIDRRSIILEGPLNTGVAARFERIAASAPTARTVVLHSSGGRIGEAERIANFIRRHELDTYVETACLSACTMILLAGRDRAVAPAARIGFHAPAPRRGADTAAEGRMLQTLMRAFYTERGVAPAFADRIVATPHASMWFPTYSEMRAAGVVNRQTLGGETNAMFSTFDSAAEMRTMLRTHSYWRALEARFPDVADAAVTAAWNARSSGANDGAASAAMRAVMIQALPRILASASDRTVDEFLQLAFDQMQAAQSIGPEACAQLAQGRAQVTAIFPPQLVQREMQLMERAMTEAGSPPPLDRGAAEALLVELLSGMTLEQQTALGQLEDPSASGKINATHLCEASIAIYRHVAARPPAERQLLARYLFTAE